MILVPAPDSQLSFAGVNASSIRRALARAHDPERWALINEFRPGTGNSAWNRIDVFAVDCWKSVSGIRMTRAYEIKISRADYLREVKDPGKRKAALLWSNEFYFLTPTGLLSPSEIPVECGLVEVMPDESLNFSVPAPFRERLPPTWAFVAAIARRVALIERRTGSGA